MMKVIMAMLAILALFVRAQAQVVTLNFGSDPYTVGSVAPSSSLKPWVMAEFTQQGLTTISLIVTAPNLTDPEFLREIDFSLNPAIDLSQLGIDFQALDSIGVFTVNTVIGDDIINAGGGLRLDLGFEAGTAQDERFKKGARASFLITSLLPIDVENFLYPEEKYGYLAVIHVQGTGGGEKSYWGASDGVPEGEVYVASLALMGLVGYSFYRHTSKRV